MMLFVTLRFVTVGGPVRFQVVPFARLMLEVAPGVVAIAPVSIEAFAFIVIAVPDPVA